MEKQVSSVKEDAGPAGKRRWFTRFGAQILDQVYPPVCLGCALPVARVDGLCAACWKVMQPITPPLCPVLGLPFAVPIGAEARSAEAIADPPPFDRARSAVVYNDMARSIVSRLKYGDRPELARFCARVMATACQEVLEGQPVLVPVPLHRFRQWQRRYNQSAELCRALSDITGSPVATDIVWRKRRTRQQVGLSAAQRARNVAGAFAVRPDVLAVTGGRRVVIVDDVITTGATVKALTRALKRAGCDQIDVISFARVVIGPDMPI